MNLELARMLEEKISSVLQIADANGLADIAIKLNEALVLVNDTGRGPPGLSDALENGEPAESGDRERHQQT